MDYLDRLEQDNVPETWHDYKPTHFKRPAYLIEAAEEVDQAWSEYDAVVEFEIFSEQNYFTPRFHLVTKARMLALRAAARYSKMYERWSKEQAEKLEVTE